MNRDIDFSQRQAAIIAGVGLLLMTFLAIFANFFVLESLVQDGEAVITANNISSSIGLFRLGICSLLIVVILDIVVAWALYIFLKPVNKSLSLITAIFRIVYAAIFGVSLIYLFNVVELLSGDSYLTVFETNQLYTQVMLSIKSFNTGWDIGIVIFGLHLAVLGYLVYKYKSNYITKILGILLIVASSGYIIDAFGGFLIQDYNLTFTRKLPCYLTDRIHKQFRVFL